MIVPENTVPTFERPQALPGATLKLLPPVVDHALYVTVNSAEFPDGSVRPVEVFVNSKDTTHFQYVTCITRLLSAVLRQAEEFPWYALDELIDTFDPAGGYIIPRSGGTRANGLISHLGIVLLAYCEDDLGLVRPKKEEQEGGAR